MDPGVNATVNDDGRRIDIQPRQDALMRGALDLGGPFREVALNLRIVQGTAAHRAMGRGRRAGHQSFDGLRQGLAVIGNCDHDAHFEGILLLRAWWPQKNDRGSALISLHPIVHNF